MTHPATRRLDRAHADITWLQTRIPLVLNALETIAATGIQAAGNEPTSGTRTTTSVEAAALHTARAKHDELDARLAEMTGVVADLVRYVRLLPVAVDPRLKHAAAAEALRARCCGGEGEWADPQCPNLASRTIKSDLLSNVRLDVCWTCISRRRRLYGAASEEVAS